MFWKTVLKYSKNRVIRNGFWIVCSVSAITMILLWYYIYYSNFWWLNSVSDGYELCDQWALMDRTITKCHGKPLSWRSRTTDIGLVSSAAENSKLSKFKPRLSVEAYTELMEVLEVFISACKNASIPWTLYGGSILGAVRHFGMIPWDDDIDVLFDVTDQGRLKRALSTMSNPSYQMFDGFEFQWKFYKMSKRSTYYKGGKNPFPPFIDIFFYDHEQNNTVVRNKMDRYSFEYFNIGDLLPVKLRPFEDFLLPIPNNANKILERERYFDWNRTCLTSMDHMSRKLTVVKCVKLYDSYPFVFRNNFITKVEQTLKLRGESILTLENQNID